MHFPRLGSPIILQFQLLFYVLLFGLSFFVIWVFFFGCLHIYLVRYCKREKSNLFFLFWITASKKSMINVYIFLRQNTYCYSGKKLGNPRIGTFRFFVHIKLVL